MGILISMAEPTRGVLDAVNHEGTYSLPTGQQFPRLQVMTIAQPLRRRRPHMLPTLLPYIAAPRRQPELEQLSFES